MKVRRALCLLAVVSLLAACERASGETTTQQGTGGDAAGTGSDATGAGGSATAGGGGAVAETQFARDVSYPPPPGGDPASAKLDVFYRDDGAPKRLALMVHGGSWVGGDKANFEAVSTLFIPWWLDRDYVVASVNFRLATPLGQPLAVAPTDQVRDLAHALAWLDEHGGDFGVTEPGAVAFGFSSGAHLVALLGADESYVEEVGLQETAVAATISFDVHAYDVPVALGLMQGSVVEPNIPLIEHLFGATSTEQLVGSPIAYVDGYVAPALLLSAEPSPLDVGSHGYIVSTMAEHYRDALALAGHQAETAHFDNETHNSLVIDFGSDGDAPTATVEAFLGDVF